MTMSAMTVQDVAEYLNVDPKTVYRMVKRGELPGFKVGGSWRFHKEDLDAWILKQKEVAQKEAEKQ
jgi:excisionase family DNA binding protein